MNYSALEDYDQKCRQIQRKSIWAAEICRRWFRNYYVLYQYGSWFTRNVYVMEYGTFDPFGYIGEWYGPIHRITSRSFCRSIEIHPRKLYFGWINVDKNKKL